MAVVIRVVIHVSRLADVSQLAVVNQLAVVSQLADESQLAVGRQLVMRGAATVAAIAVAVVAKNVTYSVA
jgi:hypothetical protein